MDREHLHTESARRLHCSRDGVRDIVKLEIEPDLRALGQNGAHNFGTFGRVKLQADFEKRDFAAKLLNEFERLFRCRDVQRHDDFVSGVYHSHFLVVMSSGVACEAVALCEGWRNLSIQEQEIPRLRSE